MGKRRGKPASDQPSKPLTKDIPPWEVCKNKGNVEYGNGNYEEAVCQYTQAIEKLYQDGANSSMFNF